MSKATAIAHPIQGLVKYHGLRDPKLRLPLHDSISVCTAPFETRTTVEVRPDLKADVVEIDGQPAAERAYERAVTVINAIRQKSGRGEKVFVKSANNFPSNIGLGASSSGFAALAFATDKAFEAGLSRNELSAIARLGSGSACRALVGGYAQWYAGNNHESSFAEPLATAKQLPMSMVIAIIPAFKHTEDAHKEAMQSPLLPCRVAFARALIDDMRGAIARADFTAVAMMAEQDTLCLHATTMTGPSGHIHWQPETLQVMHEVRRMRAEGLECYFSIDTGATVYINSTAENQNAVKERIDALGIETALASVGSGARLVRSHLF